MVTSKPLNSLSLNSSQVTFFGEESPVFHEEQGILFVYHPDGRPTGDAFVLFENAEHSKLALAKHRQTIGKRYVELFQMNRHEVIQVFTRHTLPSNVFSFTSIRGMRPAGLEPLNLMQNNAYASNVRNIIRLRGLPYSASVQDILDFLGDFAKFVSLGGVHMVYNYQVREFRSFYSLLSQIPECFADVNQMANEQKIRGLQIV